MKNYKILLILLTILSITGCKDFFDVNEPSNTVNSNELRLQLFLPSVEYYIARLEYSKAYPMGQLQQQIASFGEENVDQHYETSMYGVWSKYYTKILLPIKKMKILANEQNAVHYKGVIEVLDALSLGMVTDTYGDIPYEEAGLGSDNLQPNVNTQQELYGKIQDLLDAAINHLDANDTSNYIDIPGDVVYYGNLDKWKKLAYTLKARYALHLTKINGVQAAQDALNYLQNGFTSNDDDFQLHFNDKNINPWNGDVIQNQNSAIFTVLFSEQLINFMNGTIFATASIDPRLNDYVDNGGASNYNGAVNGNLGKDANGNSANTYLNENSYYFGVNSPIVLVSYMESRFLKAEAEFLVNGGSTTSTGSNQAAYDAYIEGITASMDKVNIDSSLRNAYITDPAIAVTPANLKLQHIMVQKYIALLLNSEIFTDLRRYDFSTDVYPGLDFPVNRNPDMPTNEWPRRAIYPISEISKNHNLTQVNFWQKMWWDQ